MNAITTTSFDQLIASSKPTQALLNIAGNRGWIFTVLGIAPMPEETVDLPRWRIVPAQQDHSMVPVQTAEKVRAVFASGIPIKGFLIVHEKPKLLPAPGEESDFIEGEFREIKPGGLTIDVSQVLSTGLKISLQIVGLAAVALVAVAGVVLPAVFTLGSALLLDPICIAILHDPAIGDIWVEIDRWVE